MKNIVNIVKFIIFYIKRISNKKSSQWIFKSYKRLAIRIGNEATFYMSKNDCFEYCYSLTYGKDDSKPNEFVDKMYDIAKECGIIYMNPKIEEEIKQASYFIQKVLEQRGFDVNTVDGQLFCYTISI